MLETGTLVDGKYKILNRIGSGGMSVVYMAINEKANKTWAIKEIRKDGILDFEAVKQGLIVEIDMLKRLNHVYLPSIIDVIEDENTFLIVMDYIEGNPLSGKLKEEGAMPQELVIEWAKQLCDVLAYLHSREPGIIYRDMKPSNVMLKPDGNITLIDFGTAREFKERNLADTTCLGTVGYAAPEQFGGMGQTDARTDIYCLGATLYHIITGCNPSEPPYEIRSICEINPKLSSGLDNIIQKCIQRNPDDRYQSAEELMYALEHYEEEDDLFRKKEKRKMGFYIALNLLLVGTLISGSTLAYMGKTQATNSYEGKIFEAQATTDYVTKIQLYEEALSIPNQGAQKNAYLGLIQAYKDNDGVFSTEEAKQLERLVTNNKELLKDELDTYVELSFEIGKLFWYYYSYGDDNQITKAKSSIDWFNEVILYAGDDFNNYGMAKVYWNIGVFYRDITMDITEANDSGKYIILIENLQELMDTVAVDDEESEIVRLELLALVRSALQQYTTKFKNDGIAREELDKMLDSVSEILDEIVTTTDTTQEKKEDIINFIAATRKSIEHAYSTN